MSQTGGVVQVNSVSRTFDIVEALESIGGTATISRIAALTGHPLPTVHRLMQTLVVRGYLRQLPDRRYRLTSRFRSLGTAADAMLDRVVVPILRELADSIGESASVAMLVGGSAEYVAQATGQRVIRPAPEVGRRVPLHSTGVGKALLSMYSDDEVRNLMRRSGMAAHTPNTKTCLEALLPELDLIRTRGFAIEDEEMELRVRCVAVPLNATTAPLAMSVSGPSSRMNGNRIVDVVTALHQAQRRVRQHAS